MVDRIRTEIVGGLNTGPDGKAFIYLSPNNLIKQCDFALSDGYCGRFRPTISGNKHECKPGESWCIPYIDRMPPTDFEPREKPSPQE